MEKIKFYVTSSGELVILESHPCTEIWRGMPEGVPVSKAISAPNTNDIIVLLEYSHNPKHSFNNLIRIGPDGSIIWYAELPKTAANDAYVEMELRENSLLAWSWSGYKAVIDLNSGNIVQKAFTK